MSLDRPVPRLTPWVVVVLMLLGLALQTTLLNVFGSIRPDLVLVAALCAGLLTGPGAGAAYGATAGLILGSAQGAVLGTLGISYALGAALAGMVETRIQRDHVVVPALTVLVGTIATHAVVFVMSPQLPPSRPLRIALATALLNTLFALPVYRVMLRWGMKERGR